MHVYSFHTDSDHHISDNGECECCGYESSVKTTDLERAAHRKTKTRGKRLAGYIVCVIVCFII